MNRQKFLVALLVVVAVTMLPFYFFDQASRRVNKEKAEIDGQMALLRDKVTAVQKLEEQLEEARRAASGLEERLVGSNPFADMERELRTTAARAGVRMNSLSLTGATTVEGLPLLQYGATVEVAGTVEGFVEFLRLLEQHPLLIEIPDLKLHLPSTGTSFQTTLSLHFYGQGPSR